MTPYAVIGTVNTVTRAWRHTNIAELLDGPDVRGSDLTIPFKPGQQPRPRIVDATVRRVELNIDGRYAPAGTTHPDPVAGKFANLRFLVEAWLPDNADEDHTFPLSVVVGVDTYVGRCIPSPQILSSQTGPHTLRAVVRLVLPDGYLEFDESESS